LAHLIAQQVSDIRAGEYITALRQESSLFTNLVQVLRIGDKMRRKLMMFQ